MLIDTDSGKVLAVLGGKFTGQNVNAVKENSTTSSKNEKHYALPIVPKKQRKQQIIDFVKQRINIDLEKAVTDKDFKGYPYISIPGKKVGENEAILRQKILSPLQNHVEFVDGGGYGIAIVPKDFIQREKEEREKKKAKDELPNMIGDGGSEGTNPFALDGDFNEGEHPRDSDGKFTSNGEAGNSKTQENIITVGGREFDLSQVPKEALDKINSIHIELNKDNTLPGLMQEDLDELGMPSKPVLLKKNIIEKNLAAHKDIQPEEFSIILGLSLYNSDYKGRGNSNKPAYFNFLCRIGDNKNTITLIELSEEKDNFEIINFHYLSDEGRKRKEKK